METFNQELKSALLAEIIKHREQDRVVQGMYGGVVTDENFRGCAVGCSIHSLFVLTGKCYCPNDHEAYETELGIPRILGELQDVIHEGLDDADYPTWPERFMGAVPAEIDLSLIFPKFALWLLSNEVCGLRQKAETDAEKDKIEEVTALCRRKINGEAIAPSVWKLASYSPTCFVDQDVSFAASSLCLAFTHIGKTRTHINNALRKGSLAFLESPCMCIEEYYKLCADKLIELLKAEGKNGI